MIGAADTLNEEEKKIFLYKSIIDKPLHPFDAPYKAIQNHLILFLIDSWILRLDYVWNRSHTKEFHRQQKFNRVDRRQVKFVKEDVYQEGIIPKIFPWMQDGNPQTVYLFLHYVNGVNMFSL